MVLDGGCRHWPGRFWAGLMRPHQGVVGAFRSTSFEQFFSEQERVELMNVFRKQEVEEMGRMIRCHQTDGLGKICIQGKSLLREKMAINL